MDRSYPKPLCPSAPKPVFAPLPLNTKNNDEHDSSWGLRIPGSGGGGRRTGGGDLGGGRGRGGLQELHGHEKAVTSLSVTTDSSVLVSASEDGTARSWHVASRQCVQKTEGVGGAGGKGACREASSGPHALLSMGKYSSRREA